MCCPLDKYYVSRFWKLIFFFFKLFPIECTHIYNAEIVSFYKNIYIFINGNLIYPGFSPSQNVNIIDG
jgi:hypothetical protein